MRAPHSSPRTTLAAFISAAVLHLSGPSPLSAQDFRQLVLDCGGVSEGLTILCHDAALALDAGRIGLAASASGGSDVPGSASTMGYRIRGFPRFALSARGGMTRFSMVELPEGAGVSSTEGALLPSLQLSGTLGVFDGFSPQPTVGGVLSFDVLASGHALFPPKDRGFQGGLLGWGVGARLGILRESFTLPGVSLSATRRWMGSTSVGNLAAGSAAEATFDVNVTSIRGVVGKDILGLGALAGVGWDRISGEGAIHARVPTAGPEGKASSSDLQSKRVVFFAGGSMTFLILQVSGEAGWSRGLDHELPTEPSGDRFPSTNAYFASLALRVTF